MVETINHTVINNLSGEGKVFYYGSTALFIYKDNPIKLFRVLTNLNVARLAQIIPGLKFSRDYYFDCYTILDDGTIITFFVDENTEKDDFAYLAKVKYLDKINPLLFLYSPITNKFYSLNEKVFKCIKNNIIFIPSLDEVNIEDILDLSLIACEKNMPIELGAGYEYLPDWDLDDYPIESLLPFLEAILTSRHPYNALIFLENIGLLRYFFPFLNILRGVKQDRCLHPEGDVFEHTIHCFQFLKKPSLRLAYGLLLHDYGKGIPTRRKGFKEHASLGKGAVRKILHPLGYSNAFIEDVKFFVEYHMVNSYFFRLPDYEKVQMFNNDRGSDLLKLYKADTMGSIGKLDDYKEIVSQIKKFKSRYVKRF